MSLVAHLFGRVEFRIVVVVFYRQAQLKKLEQIFEIDTSKSMSYKPRTLENKVVYKLNINSQKHSPKLIFLDKKTKDPNPIVFNFEN
jgi:hypothetical protein